MTEWNIFSRAIKLRMFQYVFKVKTYMNINRWLCGAGACAGACASACVMNTSKLWQFKCHDMLGNCYFCFKIHAKIKSRVEP